MTIVIPLLCFSLPLLAGFLAVRQGIGWAVPVLALGFAVLAIWAIWQGRQVSGWDGIGYAILAILMATPALLGILAGGAIAWWRAHRVTKLADPG